MSISNHLNKIKNAVFGKDVRGAIHDAIKQCYDDASINHDNANMEVKLARGTHDTLNDRLNKSDQKLTETNTQLSEYINKKPLKFHCVVVKGNNNSNCFIVEFSNGKNMFIDVGNSSEWDNVKEAIDSLQITRFDYGIITHTHWDHVGNLDNFLTTYDCSDAVIWRQAGADFTNPNLIENEDDFNAVWKIFENHNINPIIPENNLYIEIDDDTLIHLLNTDESWIDSYYSAQTEYRDHGSNFNNWSVVCEIIHKGIVILSTSDIESAAQDKIAPYIRKADLMTAPHHACNRNFSKSFFYAAYPKNVLIPVNKKSLSEYNAQYKEFNWYKENSIDIVPSCNTGDLLITYESDGSKIKCKTITIANIFSPAKNYSSIYEVVPAYGMSNATVDMRLSTLLSHMNIGDTLRCNIYNDMDLFNDLKQLFNRHDFTNGVEVEIFKRQNENCYTVDLREMTYSMRAVTKTGGNEWFMTGNGYLGYINGHDNLADCVSNLPVGNYTINYKALAGEDLYGSDNYNINVNVLTEKKYAMLTAIPRSDNKLSVYFGTYNYQFTKNKIIWNHSAINKWDIGYMNYIGTNMSAQNTTTQIHGAMLLGKSIFNLLSVTNYELGHINGTTGENIASTNRFRTKNIVKLPSKTMTVKCYNGLQVRQIVMFTGTTRSGSSQVLNKTSHSFEVDANVDGVRIVFSKIDDSDITISNDLKCMLFEGNYENANIPFLS